MGEVSVQNILVSPLQEILTDGGSVLHAIKKSDLAFCGFGEAYFSIINYKAIKAWKKHTKMTCNLIVPEGLVKFVFIDEFNSIHEEIIGRRKYSRITVPPGIWFGFCGLDKASNLILNISNIPHDEKEVVREKTNFFDYIWNI